MPWRTSASPLRRGRNDFSICQEEGGPDLVNVERGILVNCSHASMCIPRLYTGSKYDHMGRVLSLVQDLVKIDSDSHIKW